MSTYNFSNKDALTYLGEIENGSVDLILTDPPYIISKKTGFTSKGEKGVERFRVSMDFGEWDNDTLENHTKLMELVTKEFYRVLKKSGTVIIWYDLWKIESLARWLTDARFKQLRLIEWLKTNPVPLNSKSNYLTNAREVAVLGVKGGKPVFHSEYDNGVYNKPIHRDGGKRMHPTQKSLDISRELIEKHSNPGDIVLDCFAGSATHLVAALQVGRRATGCELDSGYFKLASERLEKETSNVQKAY